MKICTIIVTRSKSCSVKTLHTILKLNIKCIKNNTQNEIVYVNDDPFAKSQAIKDNINRCDRIFFIDFGINVDDDSLDEVLKTYDNIGFLVFPGVKEGIDWNLFKNKVNSDTNEPIQQMGLNFDTSVGKKVSKNIYHVNDTNARCWVLYCKNVLKNLSDKKGRFNIKTNFFEQAKENGIKIYAFTAAKLVITYTHECISNILNIAGVKTG
jgi:hypothetical protein